MLAGDTILRPTRRYTINYRDGRIAEVHAETMWPTSTCLEFTVTVAVIGLPRAGRLQAGTDLLDVAGQVDGWLDSLAQREVVTTPSPISRRKRHRPDLQADDLRRCRRDERWRWDLNPRRA